jgi:antitoxin component of MazEF toxin-antitoxin module
MEVRNMQLSTKIFALGNSNAIRIPKVIMEALSLNSEDSIIIEIINNDEILIRKQTTLKPYPSINKLFFGYTGTYNPVEIGGDTVGKEQI